MFGWLLIFLALSIENYLKLNQVCLNLSRRFTVSKNYNSLPANEGDEIRTHGIFNFNISRIMEYIRAGKLDAEEERINVKEWFKTHLRG